VAATFQVRYRIPAQTTAWTTFGPTFSASPGTVTGLANNTAYNFQIVATDPPFTALSSILSVSTPTVTSVFASDFSNQFG
jgi:hypothetical protein